MSTRIFASLAIIAVLFAVVLIVVGYNELASTLAYHHPAFVNEQSSTPALAIR